MIKLDARELDRLIHIERLGEAQHDGVQNVPGAYTFWRKRYAKYIGSPGGERYANAETAASAPGLFRVRWDVALDPETPTGISTKDRIRHPAKDDGTLYEIVSIQPYGRRVGIDIGVVRVVR
ncbi:phage head completion protein [Sphingomonas hankookensis]|uniref:phage head completion protein n=1 Tax=Sphingomonas hankookensis TaxID=563996 RepID=UPI003D30336A